MNEIARKHIDISIRVKQIAKRSLKDCQVYIATYTTGRAGQCYQRIEEESGKDFWSIKAWTKAPHRRLKAPDLVVTQDDRVKFFVEVKWGTVADNSNTDLLISEQECEKMRQLLGIPEFICRIRGPAVWDKRRYKSVDFQVSETYKRDRDSKFILVSDFSTTKRGLNPEFHQIIELWKSSVPGFLLADINIHVGKIRSLEEILSK